MRGFNLLVDGKYGETNVIDAKEYKNINKDRIERYSNNRGRVSYDLNQSQMLTDVAGISYNAFYGTLKGLWAIRNNDYESFKEVEEEEWAITRQLKQNIDKELNAETSGVQSFVAGVPIHLLRQITDVRQYPTMLLANEVGAAVGMKIANSLGGGKAAYYGSKVIAGALEEGVEEIGDELVTEGELNWLNILTAATAGGGLALLFGKGYKGTSKAMDIDVSKGAGKTVDPSVTQKATSAINKGIDNYTNTASAVGENVLKVSDTQNIAVNVSEIAGMKGKYINPEKIRDAGITINGVNIQTAKDVYTPKIVDYIINNQLVKDITNREDFLKAVSDREKFNEIAKVIKEAAVSNKVDIETKQAFEWFSNLLDRQRIKEIDADASTLQKEALKSLYERQGYVPVFKDQRVIEGGYPYVDLEVPAKRFNSVSKAREKYSYKSSKNDITLNNVKEDLGISNNAKITKVTSNKDTSKISVSWEENGYRNFSTVENINGKWRGDIYRTDIDIPKKTNNRGKVKSRPKPTKSIETVPEEFMPTNIIEDIFGKYDLDMRKLENVDEVTETVIKRFSLDTPINSKTPNSVINRAYRDIVKGVGKIVKRKYNFQDIAEAVDFYKKKYGLNFELEEFEPTSGRVGEAEMRVNPDTGETTFIMRISKNTDENFKFGILRHEVEHLRNFKNNPDFKSKPTYAISKKRTGNILEYLDKTSRQHFSGVSGNWELQYIISNELDNLVHGGKLDKTIVTTYGLDIPFEEVTTYGLDFIQETVENTKNTSDAVQRLAGLKREINKYYKHRRGLKRILTGGIEPKKIPFLLNEYITTTILRPFRKIEYQMQNTILKAFEVDIDGNIMSGEALFNWCNENGFDFMEYVAFNKVLPDKIKNYAPQLEKARTELYKIIDGLTVDGLGTREEILNSIMYDESGVVRQFADPNDVKAALKHGNQLDSNTFFAGRTVKDEILTEDYLNPVDTSERLMSVREKFAEAYYKFFANPVKRVEILFNSPKKINPKTLIKSMREARECMTTDDFIAFLNRHKAMEVPEIKAFLERNPNILKDIAGQNIEANMIKYQKYNAMRFFTYDMSSHKGALGNSNFETYLHKVSRFKFAQEQGLILPEEVSKFVKTTKLEQRMAADKLYRDISASYAIKEIFPGVGYKEFSRMLDDVQGSILGNRDIKTYIKDVERIIDGEIGKKLGHITNAPRTSLDTFTDGFLRVSNLINLTGLKAFRELAREPIGMARASVLEYGGNGLLDTYKTLLNSMAIIKFDSQRLARIEKAIGTEYENALPIGLYNIAMENLDDPFGAKAFRIARDGSTIDKAFFKLGRGMEKLNYYGTTQNFLKLASYFNGGKILDKVLGFDSIGEIMEKMPDTMRRALENLEITDTDLKLFKEIKNTSLFKDERIFSKMEFFDSLTPEKISDALGREITEEEYRIIRKSVTDKADNLYTDIVSNVSPTEPEGLGKSFIGTQSNPVERNMNKLMGNFKSSIKTDWQRMIKSYHYSNVNSLGKFDYSNTPYQKRLLQHMLEATAGVAVGAAIFDADLYANPEEYIEERINDLVDDPGSILWVAMQEYFNTWGLTTGSNVTRRPMSFAGQVMKGDFEKAADTAFKWSVGTDNANLFKKMFEMAQ